ncbi:MAG: recombinase RecA [Candidatus Melainabacteria bacterium]|jgi:recombination protein RecA
MAKPKKSEAQNNQSADKKSDSTITIKKIDSEKLKVLNQTLEQIEKDFGKGSIMRLGAAPKIKVESIPTGSLNLDLALGIGGIPKGRIIEIYGPESSGKTTIAMHACAEVQKQGGIAAFIDAEHALDPEYAKRVGVNVDELLVSQPDTGEQALEILDQLIRSSAVDIIVIDSVAALVPKAEIEGDMGDSLPGLQARLMSQALRKIAGITSRTGTTILFINQLRQKIGITYGSNETTSGGNALKFYASVRLDIRRIETLKKGEVEVGNRVRVKVVKNKVAPPFRKAEFDIKFGEGIDQASELVDMGVGINAIKKSGTWYSWLDDGGEETRIGQGKESAIQYLKDNPTLAEHLREKVIKSFTPSKLNDHELAVIEESGELKEDIEE